MLTFVAIVSSATLAIVFGMAVHKWLIYRSLREEFGDETLEKRQLRIIQGGKGRS